MSVSIFRLSVNVPYSKLPELDTYPSLTRRKHPMDCHNPLRDVLSMDHMQSLFLLQLRFRPRNPLHQMTCLPHASPQPRKVEHTATQRKQLILGNSPVVRSIVIGMSRHPERLLRDLKDARAAELDVVRCSVGVGCFVQSRQASALPTALKRESDENGVGVREGVVLVEIRVRVFGVVIEPDSANAAGGGGGGLGYVFFL